MLFSVLFINIFYLHDCKFDTFSGPHPDVSSLTEDPVELQACLYSDNGPCSSRYTVFVRKCDEEVQYYLHSTAIYSAFCLSNSFFTQRIKNYNVNCNQQFHQRHGKS